MTYTILPYLEETNTLSQNPAQKARITKETFAEKHKASKETPPAKANASKKESTVNMNQEDGGAESSAIDSGNGTTTEGSLSAKPTHQRREEAYLQALPNEIKLDVVASLPRLDQLCLKLTCRACFPLVPDIDPTEAFDLEADLRLKVWAKDPLACSNCLRLRSRDKFIDKQKRGDFNRGGRKGHSRICIDCGLIPDDTGHALYSRATWLKIGKVSHIVCIQCGKIGRCENGKGEVCPECWHLKFHPKLVAHAVPAQPDGDTNQYRIGEAWTSYGTVSDATVIAEAALAASNTKTFLAERTKAQQVRLAPSSGITRMQALKEAAAKKAQLVKDGSIKYSLRKAHDGTPIGKHKPRPTTDSASKKARELKQITKELDPELPHWHNAILLPAPSPRVGLGYNNAISSKAFTAKVKIAPNAVGSAMSDAELTAGMLLKARQGMHLGDKARVGWFHQIVDVEMED